MWVSTVLFIAIKTSVWGSTRAPEDLAIAHEINSINSTTHSLWYYDFENNNIGGCHKRNMNDKQE